MNEIARAIGVLEVRPSHRISLGVWFDLEARRNDREEKRLDNRRPSYRLVQVVKQQQEIDARATDNAVTKIS